MKHIQPHVNPAPFNNPKTVEAITKMDEKKFSLMFEELVTQLNRRLKEKALAALKSGAIDIDQWEANYRLPKLVMYACLKESTEQFRPLTSKDLKEAQNLVHFI